jgi:hypothetical protein
MQLLSPIVPAGYRMLGSTKGFRKQNYSEARQSQTHPESQLGPVWQNKWILRASVGANHRYLSSPVLRSERTDSVQPADRTIVSGRPTLPW